MQFNALEQIPQKLKQNPNLSKRNKEVLNDFLDKRQSNGTTGQSIK